MSLPSEVVLNDVLVLLTRIKGSTAGEVCRWWKQKAEVAELQPAMDGQISTGQ